MNETRWSVRALAVGLLGMGCVGHQLASPGDGAATSEDGAADLVAADAPAAPADVSMATVDAAADAGTGDLAGDAAIDQRAPADVGAASDARLACGDATCSSHELCLHQTNRGGGQLPAPDGGVCPSGSVMMIGKDRWCEGHSESFRCATPPACDAGGDCPCDLCLGCECPGPSAGMSTLACTCFVP
jgi:hypothetical protein